MHQTKMIALDLDGTTLRTDGTLSDAVKTAMEQAIAEGVHVVIASGRPLEGLPAAVTSIEGISYAVVSNGAGVYHMKNKECIWSKNLPANAVSMAVSAAEAWGYTMEFFLRGSAYGAADYIADPAKYGRSEQFVSYVQSTRIPIADVQTFIRENEGCFDSIALICPEMREKRQVMERLRRMLPDVYVTTSGGDLIELMHRDTGKAKGLEVLAEICGIAPKEIAAFGNGDNDADMLSYAGSGFAVENASVLCKESSDYLVNSNDEDGVADGIRMLLRQRNYGEKEEAVAD